jgi:phosphatidylglycerophosphatase A
MKKRSIGIRKALNRVLACIVTCCYVGYIPGAPGTYASALGCVFIYFFPSIFGNIYFCIGLALFSILCVNFFTYDGEDPSYIVIDEFAGICVTLAAHNITPINIIIGFVLFRIFDITKPFPIKQAEHLKGAYGIVADDVIAGIFANSILIILGQFL